MFGAILMVSGNLVETDFSSIFSLVIVYSFGSSLPLFTRSLTFVPSLPLILSAAASTVIPFVDLPSISKISSSAFSPARSPGVSSRGAIIKSLPSLTPI